MAFGSTPAVTSGAMHQEILLFACPALRELPPISKNLLLRSPSKLLTLAALSPSTTADAGFPPTIPTPQIIPFRSNLQTSWRS
jgi:hypothetical protein